VGNIRPGGYRELHASKRLRTAATDRTAAVIIAGLAFMQNLRRGHYELGFDTVQALRVATAFTELTQAI
jgi:transposase, IS6 family